MIETLRAATRELLSERIAESARNADVTALVDQTAGDMAIDVVKQVLGASAASVAPPDVIIGTTREPSRNGTGRRTYAAESEGTDPDLFREGKRDKQPRERNNLSP